MTNTCLNCNNTILSKSAKKFCSKSCSATFNNKKRAPRTVESKIKTSNTMKGKSNLSAKNLELHPKWCGIKYHPCNYCGQIISNPKRKTCSKQCKDSISSVNGTLKRRLPYKGYIFQSSWEVIIAKFLDEQQVIWNQPTKRIKWFDSTLQKDRTYLPDFYLPMFNYYLDVKNPIKQLQDADKIKQLTNIMQLRVGDIEDIKSFVLSLVH